jgi:hypothetical protein
MIEMEMGIDHVPDIIRVKADLSQLGHHARFLVSDRLKGLGKPAPYSGCILKDVWIRAGIKEDVPFRMGDEGYRHGRVCHLSFVQMGDKYIFSATDTATTHEI